MAAASRAHQGFTMPELVTVLAVTAVALSLAVPGMQNMMAGQKRASAVNGLAGALHLARSTAMTRGEIVTLCPSIDGERCADTSWDQGWIVFVDPELQREPAADSVLAADPALPPPLQIVTGEFTRSLSYQSNGQVLTERGVGQTGAFWFCEATGGDPSRGLWINASGIPRLVDQQANGRLIACDN